MRERDRGREVVGGGECDTYMLSKALKNITILHDDYKLSEINTFRVWY